MLWIQYSQCFYGKFGLLYNSLLHHFNAYNNCAAHICLMFFLFFFRNPSDIVQSCLSLGIHNSILEVLQWKNPWWGADAHLLLWRGLPELPGAGGNRLAVHQGFWSFPRDAEKPVNLKIQRNHAKALLSCRKGMNKKMWMNATYLIVCAPESGTGLLHGMGTSTKSYTWGHVQLLGQRRFLRTVAL